MLEWSFIYQNTWLFQPISHSKKLQFQMLESQLPSTFTKLALTWKTNPRSIRAVSVTWPLTVYMHEDLKSFVFSAEVNDVYLISSECVLFFVIHNYCSVISYAVFCSKVFLTMAVLTVQTQYSAYAVYSSSPCSCSCSCSSSSQDAPLLQNISRTKEAARFVPGRWIATGHQMHLLVISTPEVKGHGPQGAKCKFRGHAFSQQIKHPQGLNLVGRQGMNSYSSHVDLGPIGEISWAPGPQRYK